MIYETFIKIADIVIRIKSKRRPQREEENKNKHKNFIITNCSKEVNIELNLQVKSHYIKFNPQVTFKVERDIGGKPVELVDCLPIGREQSRIQQEKKRYLGAGLDWRLARFEEKILLEGGMSESFQVLLDEDLRKGEVFIINSDKNWKISNIVFGFLQVLLIYYLAKHKLGVIIHSAGIKDGGRGYLFAGPSCAGKSTISRIWNNFSGIKILNDDRIVIRKKKSQFFIYSTPWAGDFSDYLRFPLPRAKLRKIFFIYHKNRNKAVKVSPRENFNLFFLSVFPPFWDKNCLKFVLNFLMDSISYVSCYKLDVKNNEEVVDYIRDLKK